LTLLHAAGDDYLLEIEVFEVKMYFDNAGCFDTSSQNVLLSWHVVFGAETLKVIEKATQYADTNVKR